MKNPIHCGMTQPLTCVVPETAPKCLRCDTQVHVICSDCMHHVLEMNVIILYYTLKKITTNHSFI
jgi:hypothetical protein